MVVRTCDLCGRRIEDNYELEPHFKIKIKKAYVHGTVIRNEKYDICEKCIKAIVTKIHGEATTP